jgi:glycosyltransferase involved in cell wall biosynthesis
MKTFLTFFPLSENEHLAKDVGTIPNILAREYGYDSYLAVYNMRQNFEHLNSIAKNLKIWYIKCPKKPKFGRISLQSILFFIKNARKIDVVNFYHLSRETKILSVIYKFFNRRGLVYIKVDTNIIAFEQNKKPLAFKNIPYFILKTLFKNVPNQISVEQQKSVDAYKANFPEWEDKIFHLPNGINLNFLKSIGFEHSKKTDKEKIIITVGRIGTFLKNNDMMLEALNGLDLKDWKFVFIGQIYDETNIKPKIEQFYLDNPNLKDKVVFAGNIIDRVELYNYYKRAAFFCLTSISESWCIALSDTLYFGCEIISTNVGCFDDITKNDFGYEIKNANELRDIFERIMNNQIDPLQNFDKIIERSKEFDWDYLCKKLHKMLQERI